MTVRINVGVCSDRAENWIEKGRNDQNVEKEKLLILSNVFFIHNAFKNILMISKGIHMR